jgi:hypothetical protein
MLDRLSTMALSPIIAMAKVVHSSSH